MATKIGVGPDALRTFAHQCEQKHAMLAAKIGQIAVAEHATTASWDGEARRAFDRFMERYYFQAEKLNNKLLETVDNILHASGKFAAQDQIFQDSIQQQESSLDLPAV